jgi:hypothetical protein
MAFKKRASGRFNRCQWLEKTSVVIIGKVADFSELSDTGIIGMSDIIGKIRW